MTKTNTSAAVVFSFVTCAAVGCTGPVLGDVGPITVDEITSSELVVRPNRDQPEAVVEFNVFVPARVGAFDTTVAPTLNGRAPDREASDCALLDVGVEVEEDETCAAARWAWDLVDDDSALELVLEEGRELVAPDLLSTRDGALQFASLRPGETESVLWSNVNDELLVEFDLVPVSGVRHGGGFDFAVPERQRGSASIRVDAVPVGLRHNLGSGAIDDDTMGFDVALFTGHLGRGFNLTILD